MNGFFFSNASHSSATMFNRSLTSYKKGIDKLLKPKIHLTEIQEHHTPSFTDLKINEFHCAETKLNDKNKTKEEELIEESLCKNKKLKSSLRYSNK